MSIAVGQGETKNLIYRIKEEVVGQLALNDKLLFAMRDIDNAVVYTQESLISDLILEDDRYIFTVTLTSELTNSMPLGEYFFDLTLIDENNQKVQLTKPKTICVLKTVGASIMGEV